jgi:predicted nucleic acid-binding protein
LPALASDQRCFVDTNVIAYAHDANAPAKRATAMDLVETLGAARRGVISTQVLAELYVTLTRAVRPLVDAAEAARVIDDYARQRRVISVAPDIVRDAVRVSASDQLHFWDALIWAAAKAAGVSVVLTEDFQNGRTIEGVLFLDPFRADFDLA